MSRTIRRKNLKRGNRFWYSRWDQELVRSSETGSYEWVIIDKEKEPKKWKKAWHQFHSESKNSNQNSPGFYYRNSRELQHRMSWKTELAKWFRDPEHEIIFNDNPIDCWRDWY